MTPQEILNSLEVLSNHGGLASVAMLLPRGPAQPRKDMVEVTYQDLRDFVAAVRAMQKPEVSHESKS